VRVISPRTVRCIICKLANTHTQKGPAKMSIKWLPKKNLYTHIPHALLFRAIKKSSTTDTIVYSSGLGIRIFLFIYFSAARENNNAVYSHSVHAEYVHSVGFGLQESKRGNGEWSVKKKILFRKRNNYKFNNTHHDLCTLYIL